MTVIRGLYIRNDLFQKLIEYIMSRYGTVKHVSEVVNEVLDKYLNKYWDSPKLPSEMLVRRFKGSKRITISIQEPIFKRLCEYRDRLQKALNKPTKYVLLRFILEDSIEELLSSS